MARLTCPRLALHCESRVLPRTLNTDGTTTADRAEVIATTTSKSERVNAPQRNIPSLSTVSAGSLLNLLIGLFSEACARHERQLGQVRRRDERKIAIECFFRAPAAGGARVRAADNRRGEQPLFEDSAQVDLPWRPSGADRDDFS